MCWLGMVPEIDGWSRRPVLVCQTGTPSGLLGVGSPFIVAFVAAGPLQLPGTSVTSGPCRHLPYQLPKKARLIVALADLVLLRAAAVFAFVLVALVRCRLQRSRFTLSFVGQQCFKLSFRCFVSIASFLGGPCE